MDTAPERFVRHYARTPGSETRSAELLAVDLLRRVIPQARARPPRRRPTRTSYDPDSGAFVARAFVGSSAQRIVRADDRVGARRRIVAEAVGHDTVLPCRVVNEAHPPCNRPDGVYVFEAPNPMRPRTLSSVAPGQTRLRETKPLTRLCGIGGAVSLARGPVPRLRPALGAMNELIAHRGPDGEGIWVHDDERVGFAHRRLTIIDLETGDQPMTDGGGNWITYNGEIYNYLELRDELGAEPVPHDLRHRGDPPRATARWGEDCVDAAARDVRLRALGRARADALLRARPLRDQAVLLRGRRRRPLLRLRGQGAAAVPAGDRDRPRGASRTT